MTSAFTIRLTTENDIPALQRVEISASAAFLVIESLGSFAEGNCATREQHLSAIEPQTSWLAELPDGEPVGFLAARPEETALHIYEISVHIDHQKRGVGRALIVHAENHARSLGLSELTLTTFKHVPWNAPFYESLGFEIRPEAECGQRLSSLIQGERSAGLPAPEMRCAMRKVLA